MSIDSEKSLKSCELGVVDDSGLDWDDCRIGSPEIKMSDEHGEFISVGLSPDGQGIGFQVRGLSEVLPIKLGARSIIPESAQQLKALIVAITVGRFDAIYQKFNVEAESDDDWPHSEFDLWKFYGRNKKGVVHAFTEYIGRQIAMSPDISDEIYREFLEKLRTSSLLDDNDVLLRDIDGILNNTKVDLSRTVPEIE